MDVFTCYTTGRVSCVRKISSVEANGAFGRNGDWTKDTAGVGVETSSCGGPRQTFAMSFDRVYTDRIPGSRGCRNGRRLSMARRLYAVTIEIRTARPGVRSISRRPNRIRLSPECRRNHVYRARTTNGRRARSVVQLRSVRKRQRPIDCGGI